jgi:serine/threonine protein kinase
MMILDQYYLVEHLGRGGMSDVYLAEQTSMDRYAAIKILRARQVISEEAGRRFRQEARAISRLSHQHIVTVYNFGELSDGSLFLAMEYVDGLSLDHFLDRHGPLPVMRTLNVIFQCAGALGYAHTNKIVHRDFKPENVMVTKQLGRDHVKVLDFGIARLLDDSFSSQPGSIVGTPQYLSPEQCRGEPASPFSDQYALGLVFYEILTGRVAIVADRLINYLHMHQYSSPKPPSQLRDEPGVELLDPIVMRMLAKNPMERFASMEEVQKQIEQVATGVLHGQSQKQSQDGGKAPAADRKPRPKRISGPRRPLVLAPSDQIEQAQPARVMLLGSSVLLSSDWERLRADGLKMIGRCERAGQLTRSAQEDLPELYVLGTTAEGWRVSFKRWAKVKPTAQRTLACVDTYGPLDCIDAVKHNPHILLGPHPAEPVVVAAALKWMQGRCRGVVEALASKNTVQLQQVSSSLLKAQYLESLLDDMRQNGLRRSAQRAIRELAEEMIMNALYHAPVGTTGWKNPLHRQGTSPVSLKPGQEAILRWSIGDQFIVVSIRDPFGSLTAKDIHATLAGPPGHRISRDDPEGGGLGIRIMLRAASHLIFLISPGHSCEVIALLEPEPSPTRRGGRSLCILQGWDREIRQIGDALWLHETVERDQVRLKLRGDINENCDLKPIFDRPGTVNLDLSGVTAINSRGIQHWLQASRKRDPKLRLMLERCSPAAVSQFNLLPILAESGTIVSILAPYFCPYCRKESTELLSVKEIEGAEAPVRLCLVCSSELEFDEDPNQYFVFIGT